MTCYRRARRRLFFWTALLATAALYVTVTKAIDGALDTWARTWP